MKRFLASLAFTAVVITAMAQSIDTGLKFQGIVQSDNVKVDSKISVKYILSNKAGSVDVFEYAEVHNNVVLTEGNMFSISFGTGKPTADSKAFKDIAWNNTKVLQVYIDINNGSNFNNPITTEKIHASPYAYYAQKSGNDKISKLEDVDLSSLAPGQILQWNGTKWQSVNMKENIIYSAGVGISVNGSVIENIKPDVPITLTGDNYLAVTGSYPNFNVALVASKIDIDPKNEIQDLKLEGNVLTITLNSAATKIDFTKYLDSKWTENAGNITRETGDVNVKNNLNVGGTTTIGNMKIFTDANGNTIFQLIEKK